MLGNNDKICCIESENASLFNSYLAVLIKKEKLHKSDWKKIKKKLIS